jgi:hypothetical protein
MDGMPSPPANRPGTYLDNYEGPRSLNAGSHEIMLLLLAHPLRRADNVGYVSTRGGVMLLRLTGAVGVVLPPCTLSSRTILDLLRNLWHRVSEAADSVERKIRLL